MEPKYLPAERDVLAILPEIGASGENGTRIVVQNGSLWLPHVVRYVLNMYAARHGMSLTLLGKLGKLGGGCRIRPRNGRRNRILVIEPWLVLVPTQVRRGKIARGTLAYINGSRRTRVEPLTDAGSGAKSRIHLLDGTAVDSLWTEAVNGARLEEGRSFYADALLSLSARIREEEQAYINF